MSSFRWRTASRVGRWEPVVHDAVADAFRNGMAKRALNGSLMLLGFVSLEIQRSASGYEPGGTQTSRA